MNTNRIKQALAEGKAIYCKTYGEARQLFEVMGWNPCEYYCTVQYDFDRPGGVCYVADADRGWNGFSIDNPPAQVIPFTALTRSRLAECLGVEDGQKFIFKNDVYSVECSGEKLRQWSSDGMNFWREMEIAVLLDMIAHPEEITPCPRWSEATIAAARAAYLIGFRYVMRRGNDPQALLTVAHTCNNGFYADLDLFLEIHPGQTVKLSVIK